MRVMTVWVIKFHNLKLCSEVRSPSPCFAVWLHPANDSSGKGEMISSSEFENFLLPRKKYLVKGERVIQS